MGIWSFSRDFSLWLFDFSAGVVLIEKTYQTHERALHNLLYHIPVANTISATYARRMMGRLDALPSIIIWLAPCAGKTDQFLSRDWLPERARWSYLARSGLPAASRKKHFPESHAINPLLTKLVRSRWLDIGLILFLRVLVHKHAKKELGQYPAILTSHLVNNRSPVFWFVDFCVLVQCVLYTHQIFSSLVFFFGGGGVGGGCGKTRPFSAFDYYIHLMKFI